MPATNRQYHIARMARSYSIRPHRSGPCPRQIGGIASRAWRAPTASDRVGAGHARDPGVPLPATGPQMFQPSGPAIEPPSASTALPVM